MAGFSAAAGLETPPAHLKILERDAKHKHGFSKKHKKCQQKETRLFLCECLNSTKNEKKSQVFFKI